MALGARRRELYPGRWHKLYVKLLHGRLFVEVFVPEVSD
jgi:hypothetical protein